MQNGNKDGRISSIRFRGNVHMKSFRRADSLVFATLILLTLARPAHGYVDGGTATMLWQMAIAGFLGFVFIVKKSWWSIVAAGKRVFGKRTASGDESNSGQ